MKQYTLLFVDDEVNILNSLRRVFRKEGYRLLTADNPFSALELMREENVDLILSDYRMKEMDGVTFLKETIKIQPDAMRIILSGYVESHVIISAINDGGVYKFITKPWDDNLLRIEIRQALERYELETKNKKLLEEVSEHNEELRLMNRLLKEKIEAIHKGLVDTIEVLTYLSRLKDPFLPSNINRVCSIGIEIGRRLGFNHNELKNLSIVLRLHDVGNIGIDSAILNKAGPLTEEERREIRRHPLIGEKVLSLLRGFGKVSRIVRHHHEFYDGKGYPDGLKGEEIPVASRITHILDVYDSLTSDRPYRRAMDPDDIRRIMEDGRGTMFDPEILDIFFDVMESGHHSHGCIGDEHEQSGKT